MRYQSFEDFIQQVAVRNPGQPEFLQAVTEVIESLWPYIAQHPKYAEHGLLDRLVEPERVVMFRVSWVDDHGEVQVNRGYRIQHSSAIGPHQIFVFFHLVHPSMYLNPYSLFLNLHDYKQLLQLFVRELPSEAYFVQLRKTF